MNAISIAKLDQETTNEDAIFLRDNLMAVSDGAGGGGIFAEKWSEYLVKNLPKEAIVSFEELDSWIESIWEPFYDKCETMAKEAGGMILNKFYDEGSFATLVAIWEENTKCQWIAYGDSVAFCYNPRTDSLQHSIASLLEFGKPPYLINYKEELRIEGFHSGQFDFENGCILFCASDALSHYIIMMYELSHCGKYHEELQNVEKTNSKESYFIKNASQRKIDFFADVLQKLMHCKSEAMFTNHLRKIYKEKLIALDDYSFVYKVI